MRNRPIGLERGFPGGGRYTRGGKARRWSRAKVQWEMSAKKLSRNPHATPLRHQMACHLHRRPSRRRLHRQPSLPRHYPQSRRVAHRGLRRNRSTQRQLRSRWIGSTWTAPVRRRQALCANDLVATPVSTDRLARRRHSPLAPCRRLRPPLHLLLVAYPQDARRSLPTMRLRPPRPSPRRQLPRVRIRVLHASQ